MLDRMSNILKKGSFRGTSSGIKDIIIDDISDNLIDRNFKDISESIIDRISDVTL